MGIIGGYPGYYLLKFSKGLSQWYYKGESKLMDGSVYKNRSKMEVLLGKDIWNRVRNKTVLDFGCGVGDEAIEIAQHGANRVVGIDINENYLKVARTKICGLPCEFVSQTNEKFDVIFSIDAFEHFGDPDQILDQMATLLNPDGILVASFGPTWYHPLGGHLYSVFPWSHLIFTEHALVRWRSDFRDDGATSFQTSEGGLNQMTIRRFLKIVESSKFQFVTLDLPPIRGLKPFANRFTREFTTSTVRCILKLKAT